MLRHARFSANNSLGLTLLMQKYKDTTGLMVIVYLTARTKNITLKGTKILKVTTKYCSSKAQCKKIKKIRANHFLDIFTLNEQNVFKNMMHLSFPSFSDSAIITCFPIDRSKCIHKGKAVTHSFFSKVNSMF